MNFGTEAEKIRDLCKRAASERVVRTYAPTKAAPVRLTVRQNADIVKLYRAGTPIAVIARTVGTTEWTVHHRLRRMGVERRPMGLSPAQVLDVIQRYELGMSVRNIQRTIGFSENTIRKELRAAGVYVDGRRKS